MKTTHLDMARSEQIGIRVNAAERRVIEAAAKASDRTIADWARLELLRIARRSSNKKN